MNLKSTVVDIKASLKNRGIAATLKRCIMEPVYVVQDRTFDRRFGVSTATECALDDLDIDDANRADSNPYQPVRPHAFRRIMRRLDINYQEFTFIDFGSGKGRAVLLASEFPFKKVIGVELSSVLTELARQNAQAYAGKTRSESRLELVCENATRFQLPADPCVLYFFNPFGRSVMEQMLRNIEASLERYPRRILVVLYNPVLDELFEKTAFLSKREATERYSLYSTM
jgi:predicted RNA methylase